jgi:hypothetical protein
MSLESVAVDSHHELSQRNYLRTVVAVAGTARRDEYVVIHFGSGMFYRTDRLGASAIRAMIGGRSDVEAIEIVDQAEAQAGHRARQLIDTLASTGTMASAPPSDGRWLIKRAAALAAGRILSLLALVVPVTPVWVLAGLFRLLPSTPLAWHVWRSRRWLILQNLRETGYSASDERWLLRVSRDSAACTPVNYLFNYLSVNLPSERLDRLIDRLFEGGAADEIVDGINSAGPTVGVFLHGPLCAAVPNALRRRGVAIVRAVAGRWHGINVSAKSGRLSDFFGDSADMNVELADPLATAALVRHLEAGHSVNVALDRSAGQRKTAKVEMLGRTFARNDGPAWLAVRSGRPVALWTTHWSAGGVVISSSPLCYPDLSLPAEARVADLSQQLYSFADAAIRQRPGCWACWSYLSAVRGSRS